MNLPGDWGRGAILPPAGHIHEMTPAAAFPVSTAKVCARAARRRMATRAPNTCNLLIPSAALLAVVVVGYATGSSLQRVGCCSLVGDALRVGMVLPLLGLFRWPRRRKQRSGRRFAAGCLFVYAVMLKFADPFVFVFTPRDLLWSVAWLCPAIAGGVLLPHRRRWPEALGCCAVLFAGVTALSYNVTHIHSGVGFLGSWMD